MNDLFKVKLCLRFQPTKGTTRLQLFRHAETAGGQNRGARNRESEWGKIQK